MNREDGYRLLAEHIKNSNLIKHCLAVEAAMRAYARKFGENEEKWGITGLMHDLDYEEYPGMEAHSLKSAEILAMAGYPADVVEAVKAHNEHHGIPRATLMAKALYAVDELTGLVVAAALVRPTKKIADVKVKSVKKKMKDKSFARNVDREQIKKGAEDLGVDLDEHIQLVIDAMKEICGEMEL